MDVATITALATAGSALANLIKDLKMTESNPTLDQMTEQVIGLQSLIMSVQSEAFVLQGQNADLAKQVTDLETQLTEMKDWTAEKDKYEMKAIGGTGFVYALKPDTNSTEPPHWLCCACYEANRKSLVVFEGNEPRAYDAWKCSRCDARIRVRRGETPVTSVA